MQVEHSRDGLAVAESTRKILLNDNARRVTTTREAYTDETGTTMTTVRGLRGPRRAPGRPAGR
jgi:hypothetical protein